MPVVKKSKNFQIIPIKGVGMEKSYIIKGERGCVVIDLGWPSTANKIFKKHKDIKYIFITHRHYDHFGAAEYLCQKTGAKLIAGQSDIKKNRLELLKCFIFLPLVMHSWYRQKFDFNIKKEDVQISLTLNEVDIVLEDGTSLPDYNDWMVISTPGHTSDHICLYNKETKELFSGDTILNMFGNPRWSDIVTNKKTLINTIEKLKQLDIKVIYPGHGEPFKVTDNIYKKLFVDGLEKKDIFKTLINSINNILLPFFGI